MLRRRWRQVIECIVAGLKIVRKSNLHRPKRLGSIINSIASLRLSKLFLAIKKANDCENKKTLVGARQSFKNTKKTLSYRGSPIPMKTTFRIVETEFAYTSCSNISPLVRFPIMPIVPVAQNL